MPGISFLFKKSWHPQSLENQKKLFTAEQDEVRKIQREQEAAAEVAKEKELSLYEKMGDMEARDPRQSSLKFMYSQPKSESQARDNHGLFISLYFPQ